MSKGTQEPLILSSLFSLPKLLRHQKTSLSIIFLAKGHPNHFNKQMLMEMWSGDNSQEPPLTGKSLEIPGGGYPFKSLNLQSSQELFEWREKVLEGTEGHPRVRKQCHKGATQNAQEPDMQGQSIKFCEFPHWRLPFTLSSSNTRTQSSSWKLIPSKERNPPLLTALRLLSTICLTFIGHLFHASAILWGWDGRLYK